MKKIFILITIILPALSGFAQFPRKAETVSLNGKNIYYEVYGEGEPLFLLHGFFMFSKYWLPYLSDFAEDNEVYLVDLLGHGKCDPFDPDWSINDAAQHLNDLIEHLQLGQVKAIGFSYGGDVLFHLALINPSAVEPLVTIGAVGTWNVKEHPSWLAFFNNDNLENLSWIHAFQSSELQTRAILDYFKNYVIEISDEQLKSIQANVLIILGDNDDSIPLEEVSRVRKYLPKSDLWILPNSPHGAHEGENKKEFIRMVKAFHSKN